MQIKKRNPAGVIILSIITLGIYLIYWIVKTKGEIKSLGASIPTAWFIIIPIANIYFAYKYLDGFSTYVKKDNLGIIWFIAAVVAPPVMPVIIQVELNKLAG